MMNYTVKPVAAKVNYGPLPLIPSLHHHRPFFSKPISSLSLRRTPPRTAASSSSYSSTRAPSSLSSFPAFQFSSKASADDNPKPLLSAKSLNPRQNPSRHIPETLSALFPFSFIKTTLIATAAAAAIFFSRFHLFGLKPAYASSSGAAAQVETAVAEEEREKSLKQHLLSDPDDVEALRSLMEIRLKNRKFEEAIAILEKLIELEPDEVEWPLMKSHLYIYRGEVESAKNGFSELISKHPFKVEAYHGLVMAATAQEDESSDELREIEKRIDDAMKACKKENKKTDLRDFKLLVAQIRVIEGNYDEALKVYQDLGKEEPRDFRPFLCQGIIYTLLRKTDEAEKNFDKYRRLVPKGHPYARYFEDNMIATKLFAQKVENEGAASMS